MENKIRTLIKQNMISQNKNATITFKNILETAQKTAKNTNTTVTDEMIVAAIKTEIKQLNELLSYVTSEDEKYKEIQEKLMYCQEVLPTMASETKMNDYLMSHNIDKNMGICMKALQEYFGISFDGKVASKAAREYINK